jgi:hypothetical protein
MGRYGFFIINSMSTAQVQMSNLEIKINAEAEAQVFALRAG